MVSSQTNSTSPSNFHHFLVSENHISPNTQFHNPYLNSFGSDIHTPNPFVDQPELGAQFIHSLGERMSRSVNLMVSDHHHSEMGHTTRHFMDLLGAPSDSNHGSSPLSLSLESRGLNPNESMQYRQNSSNFTPGLINQTTTFQESHNPGEFANSYMGSLNFGSFMIANSVFLQPAQSVLEEVIDLGSNEIDLSEVKRMFESGRGISSQLRDELLSNGFLSADKQDIQIKISKLISLLEQVEVRYEEYCERMEELVSSFEMIAGERVAKSYTALALQAMCRHFCSLRDAIVSQIKLSIKKLSPDLPKTGPGLSQLGLFDREAHHNRTPLHQIGLIQGLRRQVWRPIRGLPETSVAILRAWLFEHFLNPYPNDSEKLTLASQTGLTKNQVSNWFINARVRLWKPMIEEIYKAECGDSSVDSSGEGHTDNAEE